MQNLFHSDQPEKEKLSDITKARNGNVPKERKKRRGTPAGKQRADVVNLFLFRTFRIDIRPDLVGDDVRKAKTKGQT